MTTATKNCLEKRVIWGLLSQYVNLFYILMIDDIWKIKGFVETFMRI